MSAWVYPGASEEMKNQWLKLCALRKLMLAKANRAKTATCGRSRAVFGVPDLIPEGTSIRLFV